MAFSRGFIDYVGITNTHSADDTQTNTTSPSIFSLVRIKRSMCTLLEDAFPKSIYYSKTVTSDDGVDLASVRKSEGRNRPSAKMHYREDNRAIISNNVGEDQTCTSVCAFQGTRS